MAGPTIEEARLVRDAVADLVWGVETVAENGVGRPWPGRERDRAGIPAQTKKPESAVGAPAVRYKLHTPLPGSWIPFVPVPQAGAKGLLLERAVLPGDVAGTVALSGEFYRPRGSTSRRCRHRGRSCHGRRAAPAGSMGRQGCGSRAGGGLASAKRRVACASILPREASRLPLTRMPWSKYSSGSG